MKEPGVKIAVIVMVGLVVCSCMLTYGLMSLGQSVERAGSSVGTNISCARTKVPSEMRVRLANPDLVRVQATVKEEKPGK